MSILDRISNIFHTKDGEIQRAYSAYDKVSDLLNARDKNPDFGRQNELDESIKEVETLTNELLENYETTKGWPGVFREMHMNLTRLWLRTGKYEESLKECDKVAEYNPLDAEELREAVEEAMSGKKFESTQLDEVGVA